MTIRQLALKVNNTSADDEYPVSSIDEYTITQSINAEDKHAIRKSTPRACESVRQAVRQRGAHLKYARNINLTSISRPEGLPPCTWSILDRAALIRRNTADCQVSLGVVTAVIHTNQGAGGQYTRGCVCVCVGQFIEV